MVKGVAQWDKQILKLREGHGWKAKPGYKIFVADHGAIRFDIPEEWIIVPGPKSIRFYDRQPPDDNCRLEVSLMRTPPVDWSGLPLSELIQKALNDDATETRGRGEVHTAKRPDLELVWTETSFMDRKERREARSRICLARGPNMHALITLDLWKDDLTRLGPAWDELVSSLEMGLSIEDPTRGPILM